MRKNKTQILARGGLLTALVALLTAYGKVPLAAGYAHLGDGAVILSGLALGPMGAICAAVGTALADILSGYPIYIPFSLVIKGFMAFAAGKWLRPEEKWSRRNLGVLLLIFLCVPAGYFPADGIFYGWDLAVLSLAGNFAQAAVGYAVSMLLLGRKISSR